MNEDFRDLLHTHPTCPFCGHVPDQLDGLMGLNCIVCRPCAENIHLRTPRYADIYVDGNLFKIWSHIPSADEWKDRDLKYAVFIKGPVDDITGNSNRERFDPARASEETQKTIVAYLSRQYESVLPRIHTRKLKDELPAMVLPSPTIIAGDWVYTSNTDALPKKEEHKQATLQDTLAG
jgi:hypothetical protein